MYIFYHFKSFFERPLRLCFFLYCHSYFRVVDNFFFDITHGSMNVLYAIIINGGATEITTGFGGEVVKIFLSNSYMLVFLHAITYSKKNILEWNDSCYYQLWYSTKKKSVRSVSKKRHQKFYHLVACKLERKWNKIKNEWS